MTLWRVHIHVFFFNDPSTTAIHTLSLHDALPIFGGKRGGARPKTYNWDWGLQTMLKDKLRAEPIDEFIINPAGDRKSTRLNSSHPSNSYAVFCLKKQTRPPDRWTPSSPTSRSTIS